MSEIVPATSFLVTNVFNLNDRDGLFATGKTIRGKVREGMVLQDDSHRQTRVLSLELRSPRDLATGEITILLERSQPNPVQPNSVLTEISTR